MYFKTMLKWMELSVLEKHTQINETGCNGRQYTLHRRDYYHVVHWRVMLNCQDKVTIVYKDLLLLKLYHMIANFCFCFAFNIFNNKSNSCRPTKNCCGLKEVCNYFTGTCPIYFNQIR